MSTNRERELERIKQQKKMNSQLEEVIEKLDKLLKLAEKKDVKPRRKTTKNSS